jgi:hypothetical protein
MLTVRLLVWAIAAWQVCSAGGGQGALFAIDNVARHADQVDALTAQIKSRPAGTKIVLKRSPASSHCVRPHDYKNDCMQLDFSAFDQPISVETVQAADLPAHCRAHLSGSCVVARVQALMSMEQLVDTLLPHGFVPAVVPEFKGITIGACCGCWSQLCICRYADMLHLPLDICPSSHHFSLTMIPLPLSL